MGAVKYNEIVCHMKNEQTLSIPFTPYKRRDADSSTY